MDVSSHQVDSKRVEADGVSFAYIKATEASASSIRSPVLVCRRDSLSRQAAAAAETVIHSSATGAV